MKKSKYRLVPREWAVAGAQAFQAQTAPLSCGSSQRSLPRTVRTDHAGERISTAVSKWTCKRGVELGFSCPGKPTDSTRVESLSGPLCQRCLISKCVSFEDAKDKIGW